MPILQRPDTWSLKDVQVGDILVRNLGGMPMEVRVTKIKDNIVFVERIIS